MRPRILPLGVAILLAALSACQPADPPPTEPFANREVVDLTYSFNESSVYWPTAQREFSLTEEFVGETDAGYYYSAYWYQGSEHGGTHLDAPKHFSKGSFAAHEVPVDRLMGPAVVVDVSSEALDNPDYQITTDDIQSWEAEHGTIPDGAFLFVRTGYGQYYPDREQYMGTAERGEDALEDLHFPGFHPDAAGWLAQSRSISAVGLDTPSLDYGQSTHFRAHQRLFEANILGFENLANLDELPPTGAHVIALPMKIEGGSGGPARVIALVPNEN